MSTGLRRARAGMAFGLTLGLILTAVFIVPRMITDSTSDNTLSLVGMAAVYIAGGTAAGGIAASSWRVVSKSWIWAGFLGVILAFPLLYVVGVIALESLDRHVLVTSIASVTLGFPFGVLARVAFLDR